MKGSVRYFNIFFLFVLLSTGCSERNPERASFSEPVYSRQYRDDSMTVIVSLSETNVPTSGKVTLMIDVHAPTGAEVTLPEIGSAVEPFSVVDGYTEPSQTLPNGKQLNRRVWVLTPGLSGESVFQPLEIYAGTESIQTEPIAVQVESLLPSDIETFEIKDIAEPVALLAQQEKKRRTIYTILGTILMLVLIPFLTKLAKRSKVEIIILPHEAAFQALENLPDDQVLRIHELNRILRVYYEARFNLPMIGKTAVEILPILEDEEVIQFLQTCEQIRFSNRIPEGFTTQAEQFVRGFVERTKEVPPCD